MNFLKKTSIGTFLFIVSFLQFSNVVFAVDPGTVLPATTKTVLACEDLMNDVSKNSCMVIRDVFKKVPSTDPNRDKCDTGVTPDFTGVTDTDVLACGIKTGSIHLWMIPYYIRYVLTFIIGMSGLASVGGIIYGGYMYLFAGVSKEQDQGKNAIKYGIIGMILTLVAWAFVNIIISLVTG